MSDESKTVEGEVEKSKLKVVLTLPDGTVVEPKQFLIVAYEADEQDERIGNVHTINACTDQCYTVAMEILEQLWDGFIEEQMNKVQKQANRKLITGTAAVIQMEQLRNRKK